MDGEKQLPLGRSRGRARGRALKPTQSTQVGESASTSQMLLPPKLAGQGRGDHRSLLQREAPSSSEISRNMAALSISDSKRTDRKYDEPITRPKHLKDKRGTLGSPIRVVANCFRVLSHPSWCIFQYHVDFSPTVESSMMRRTLLSEHNQTLGSCYLFDGMSDLKTISKLKSDVITVHSKRKTDNEDITITIKIAAELAPNHPEVFRLFNTQMRRNMQHLQCLLMGRHYFDKDTSTPIPEHHIEVWKGVLTAIREFETGLMMVVDTIHKVLRLDTVLDQMHKIQSCYSRGNYIDACTKELAGSIVMTRYNNKTYRIDDIDWSKSPLDTFETDSQKISFKEYYYKQYDIVIQDNNQPLLICRKKQKDSARKDTTVLCYLIPELCCMTGLTEEMRADNNIMRELATHTRLSPDKRVENLLTFIRRVNNNFNIRKDMSGWGLSFGEDLVTINARVLSAEKVFQNNLEVVYNTSITDFSRGISRNAMHSSVPLKDWLVITTENNRDKTEEFILNLNIVCQQMGMMVQSPNNVVCIQDDRTSSYLNAISSLSNPRLQLIIVVVPNNKKDRYDAIKKMCCIDIAVPTQVIVARTLSKRNLLRSIAMKVGVQINCKLGGEAWILKIPFKTPVMVVGYDSYKDSSQQGHTVGALVASLNPTFTKWHSQVSFHRTGGWDEMSQALTKHFANSLKKYFEWNKRIPEIIFLYRDGVSNGEIQYTIDHEVNPIYGVLKSMSPEVRIRLAFIIVNKRISTRFFVHNQNRVTNPPPGTVVDDEVTQPTRYDFFLVSQHVSQGTVAPTQYNIIEDSTGLKPEHLQSLTYKLTYLYYNWPGTIRVPAPCQYAHKLAFLTSQSLHKNAHENLADTLFYL